jgi:hypothetical protein
MSLIIQQRIINMLYNDCLVLQQARKARIITRKLNLLTNK